MSTSGRAGFSLACATRKANAPAVLSTYYEGTPFTRPDEVQLAFTGNEIGAPTGLDRRRDVMLVIGANAYRLPEITWDDLSYEWSTRVQATGGMFEAIAAAPSFEIRSDAGVVQVGTSGFSTAYSSLLGICRSQFAAAFKPWKPAPAIAARPQPARPQSMRQAAEASVGRGCNGPSTYEPDAFLSGDIDGDGVEDVVLHWGAITCSGALPRPFCGASQCTSEVFLSQLFPTRQRPEEMLGLGVRLQPLSNGNMAVAVGGSLSSCNAAGLQSCEFLYYWNGSDFVNLP